MTDNRKPEDMIVYTRTGDKGKTSLYDTTNVYKDNIRVEAYGTIDELNSALGIAKHYIDDHKVQDLIHGIQRKLFDVGAELATEDTSILITRIEEDDVKFLEDTIDHYLQFLRRQIILLFQETIRKVHIFTLLGPFVVVLSVTL